MAHTFEYKGFKVYDAGTIKERVPTYFYGCSATIMKIIEKKNIPNDQYFFASYSKKYGWKETSSDYLRRKLLIKASWVESNVPGFIKDLNIEIPKDKYEIAPPILYLDDDEKFNESGEIVEIEVRGERSFDKIWFKMTHIGKMLGIEHLRNTLADKKSAFIVNEDYQTFLIGESEKTIKKSMFLTYKGIVKLFHASLKPIARTFQNWASEKLFVIRHGTNEQKNLLVADVLGVGVKDIKAFLNTNVNTMPVVYLFIIGKVKDLRESLNIHDHYNNNDYVVKYGLTNDLNRRTSEHVASCTKISKNIVLALKYHVFLSTAENDVEKYFKGAKWHLNHPKYTELAAIPGHMLDTIVHNEFKRLGQTYGGKLQDLQVQLSNEQKLNLALKVQIERQEQYCKEMIAEKEQRIEDNKINANALLKAKDDLIQAKDELLAKYRNIGL